jgi:hypothetical protein
MENKNWLENKVFWLIAACIFLVFVYVFCISFIPIPKDNLRFADTSLGFFLGTIMAGCIGYYTGSNPKKGNNDVTGSTNTTITAVTTQP